MAARIRRDDTVVVIAGRDKGKRGKVVRVIPGKNKVVVEGVNIITRHLKSRGGVRQAGIVRQEAPIDISNVAYVEPDTGRPGRVGWEYLEDGTRVRVLRSGQRSEG
ncbi:MAG: 50S ribosomal protein L24 [Gemmatimonadetes bacterium]|nr:50S ribosomal protein L24 [Gemmatimonadota bacterium]